MGGLGASWCRLGASRLGLGPARPGLDHGASGSPLRLPRGPHAPLPPGSLPPGGGPAGHSTPQRRQILSSDRKNLGALRAGGSFDLSLCTASVMKTDLIRSACILKLAKITVPTCQFIELVRIGVLVRQPPLVQPVVSLCGNGEV